jgi:signal transduction histidine kinase
MPLRELARGLFRSDAAVPEARIETTDGRTVSLVGVPARASELAVLVLTDVTEQERRERTEREFVANASHELRTPVSAIVSAVEALQSGAKESPEDRDAFLALIERQTTRLTSLIRSLLLLARAQTQQGKLELEPVELRSLLERVAASAERPSQVEIRVDCPPGLLALAQRDVAEQVVSNLLGNALRHSPRGVVVLSGRRLPPHVLLEVSDDGPGIAANARQRIFDRFYSGEHGRRDGFGLGLAIVRDAVRALGGSIEIDSTLGQGTTARVTLAGGRNGR